MSDIMGSIAESLKMSRKRAKSIREAVCKPASLQHLLNAMDGNHRQFQRALETMHESADAYHAQRSSQRSARTAMTEAMEKARDAADELDQECEP